MPSIITILNCSHFCSIISRSLLVCQHSFYYLTLVYLHHTPPFLFPLWLDLMTKTILMNLCSWLELKYRGWVSEYWISFQKYRLRKIYRFDRFIYTLKPSIIGFNQRYYAIQEKILSTFKLGSCGKVKCSKKWKSRRNVGKFDEK